jgi:hypothetical protein
MTHLTNSSSPGLRRHRPAAWPCLALAALAVAGTAPRHAVPLAAAQPLALARA